MSRTFLAAFLAVLLATAAIAQTVVRRELTDVEKRKWGEVTNERESAEDKATRIAYENMLVQVQVLRNGDRLILLDSRVYDVLPPGERDHPPDVILTVHDAEYYTRDDYTKGEELHEREPTREDPVVREAPVVR